VKHIVCVLMFLCFAEDWGCAYKSHLGAPLAWVHDVFIEPLPIKVRPLDLVILGVFIAASARKKVLQVPAMRNALLLAVGTTIVAFAWGLARGGDSRAASWQVYLILSCILFAFTVGTVFRTPADYVTLAKWLMAAAVYRAVFCWVSHFTWGRTSLGEGGAYLTTHDDTIGWVVCILVLIVNTVSKKPSLLVLLRNFVLGVLILGAIQYNNRRLAWVSLGMALIVSYFLFPPGRAKRVVNRVLMVASPLLLLYVVVGWGRGNTIFMPLRSLSTISTQEDASTLARNAENLGLIATGNAFGFGLGSGWGRPYICLTHKYDISNFELWQYVPHNSILGLLAFTGVIGFIGFWTAIPTAVFLNARVARLARDPLARNVALVAAAQIVVCANQLYGDMGLFFFKPMYVLGISYAIALRLPRATDLWTPQPVAATPRAAQPSPAPPAPGVGGPAWPS